MSPDELNSGMAQLDKDGRILSVDEGLCRMFGYSSEEFQESSFWNLLEDAARSSFKQRFAEAAAQTQPLLHARLRFLHSNGSPLQALVNLLWFHDYLKNSPYAVAFVQEIPLLPIHGHPDLNYSSLQHGMIEALPDPIFYRDLDGRFIGCNRAFENLIGVPREQFIGKTYLPAALRIPARIFELAKPGADGGDKVAIHEESFYDRLGGWHEVQLKVAPFRTEHGMPGGLIGILYDITALTQKTKEIEQYAYSDPLTQLPNRILFHDRLNQAIARGLRDGEPAAVFFIDLYRFKEINDALGHACGDQILQAVAKRLRNAVRESDTAARLGGDEFVVLLPRTRSMESTVKVAEKILASLSQPFNLLAQEVQIGSNIGIAIFPRDGKDVESLLKNADSAMYVGKKEGANTLRFFSIDHQAVQRDGKMDFWDIP